MQIFQVHYENHSNVAPYKRVVEPLLNHDCCTKIFNPHLSTAVFALGIWHFSDMFWTKSHLRSWEDEPIFDTYFPTGSTLNHPLLLKRFLKHEVIFSFIFIQRKDYLSIFRWNHSLFGANIIHEVVWYENLHNKSAPKHYCPQKNHGHFEPNRICTWNDKLKTLCICIYIYIYTHGFTLTGIHSTYVYKYAHIRSLSIYMKSSSRT